MPEQNDGTLADRINSHKAAILADLRQGATTYILSLASGNDQAADKAHQELREGFRALGPLASTMAKLLAPQTEVETATPLTRNKPAPKSKDRPAVVIPDTQIEALKSSPPVDQILNYPAFWETGPDGSKTLISPSVLALLAVNKPKADKPSHPIDYSNQKIALTLGAIVNKAKALLPPEVATSRHPQAVLQLIASLENVLENAHKYTFRTSPISDNELAAVTPKKKSKPAPSGA